MVSCAYARRLRKFCGWKMSAGMYGAASISPHQSPVSVPVTSDRNHLQSVHDRVRPGTRELRASGTKVQELLHVEIYRAITKQVQELLEHGVYIAR